jgi:hypothetical protein
VFYNWDKVSRMRGNMGVVFSEQFTLDVATTFVSGKTSCATQVATRGGTWDQLAWGQGYCAPLVADPPNPACGRTLGLQQFLPTDQAKITSTRAYDRFTGSATLNFKAGDWLSSRAILGVDKGWDTNEWIHPIETVQSNVIQAMLEGEVLNEKPSNSVITLDWSATANRPVGSFSTATSVGAQFYYDKYEMLSVFGQGLASPLSTTINQTPVTRSRVTYEYTENKSLGFYAQEMVGWNDRAFLTGALRFDDNSAFGADFDPIIYPKLSGTWVVSEEAFWGVGFIDQLRLRGAWGKAGRQPNTLAGVNTFASWAGPGGTSAIDPSTAGNLNVGPEKSTELELGLDVSTLEGKISGEFSWYRRKNEDNLLSVSLPHSAGSAATIQRNLGVLENWGWEAQIDARVVDNDRMGFDLSLTGAYKMNEITDIGDFPGNNTIKIGFPYPNNRSAEYWVVRAEYSPTGAIVDPYGKRIQAYCDKGILLDPDPKVDPRRSRYGAIRGGETVPCEQVGGYRINAGPGFIPWSFTVNPTLTLSEVLQIRALFEGTYGSIGQDGIKLWHHRYNTAYGPVTMTDPRYVAGFRLDRQAQMAFYDKDYWKLREIGVRYQLPESWIGHFGAERASFTFSARELATLWAANKGTGLFPTLEDLNHPETTILDVDYGRSADGDGGCRADPPVTTLHVRLDVAFR